MTVLPSVESPESAPPTGLENRRRGWRYARCAEPTAENQKGRLAPALSYDALGATELGTPAGRPTVAALVARPRAHHDRPAGRARRRIFLVLNGGKGGL